LEWGIKLDTYFAATAPGLEPYAHLELARLNLLPQADSEQNHPPLEFKGDLAALYRANLYSRTASRILVRLGQFFYARTFAELQTRAARLPWERFLTPGQAISIRATCHKSKLYHSDAVAERVAAAIAERMGKESPLHTAGDEETDQPAQLIIVRVAEDKVTVSIDSTGEILYRRGYRLAVAKAPLRETLAAGIILASGWDMRSPLVDPFCGSGTIPIEAALMALGRPPGQNRRFAFMDWPNFDAQAWKAVKAEATRPESVEIPPIVASDRDAGAIKSARENAERAGVSQYIEFKTQAVSFLNPPKKTGWVVTNPPYGLRVSEGKDLRNLYAQFGNVLRAECRGWRVSVLCSDPALLRQVGLNLDTSVTLSNGGVQVWLGRGKV
jgi:putative N6-adenine-specific DNA methylase